MEADSAGSRVGFKCGSGERALPGGSGPLPPRRARYVSHAANITTPSPSLLDMESEGAHTKHGKRLRDV